MKKLNTSKAKLKIMTWLKNAVHSKNVNIYKFKFICIDFQKMLIEMEILHTKFLRNLTKNTTIFFYVRKENVIKLCLHPVQLLACVS